MRHPYLVFAVALLASCQSEPAPSPSSASGQRAPSPQAPEGKLLSLEPPSGSAVVDQEIRSFQARIARLPPTSALWEELGRAWIKKARDSQDPALYARAREAAERALALEPAREGALVLKALALQNEHKFHELRKVALLLTGKAPKSAEAWGILGDAALELGEYDEAVAAYQKMIDLSPSLPSFSRVAYLRWLYGDIEGAQTMWQDAIEVGYSKYPEQVAYCLVEKGNVHWHQGEEEEARKSYDAALRILPGYAGALLGRGRVYFSQKNLSGARDDFEAAAKARPTVEILGWLADVERALGHQEAARAAEEKLEREGRLGDFRTLALYYATHKKAPDLALRLAKKDAEQRGGVYTKDVLAFAHFRQGELTEAARFAKEALALGTRDAHLLAHAGLIFAATGEVKKAREHLEAALALQPAFDPTLPREIKEALDSLPLASSQPKER